MPGKYHSGGATHSDYRGGSNPHHISNYQPAATTYQPVPNLYHPNGDAKSPASNGLRRAGPQSPESSPMFTADHLVTWSVGSEHGVLTHEDGMRQLSKMEQKTGIFTMRCIVAVESGVVRIVDSQTGESMEKFPLDAVKEPVAVADKTGMFNNIVLFTVVDDPKDKHSLSEMHIFQVAGRPARELADTIAEASLQFRSTSSRSSRNSSNQHSPAVQRRSDSNESEDGNQPAIPRDQLRATRRVMDSELESEDDVKMGVALLNRCFDEVERFILRLKHSAKALHELSTRKKHSKGKKHGNGMLTMRSKAPSPAEFVECFQKVKLSFNLLARLRSYLHNPNATELVHFLFTPLSLLVEASNDPRFDIHDLVRKVVTPLLSKHSVDLLENCLTSKEYDFWMSLGEAWRTPRNQWSHGHIQEFRPKFSDGFQPSESWLEMFLGNTLANLVAKQAMDRLSREPEEEPAQHYNGLSNRRTEHDGANNGQGRQSSEQMRSPTSPVSPVSPGFPSPPRQLDIPLATDRSTNNNRTPWDDYQRSYLYELQQRNARIFEVILDRKGNNSKELTIRKDEIVEVVDNDRNWWKCANINGDQGFVPCTLLRKFENGEGSLPSPSNRYPSPRSPQATVPQTVVPQAVAPLAAPPPMMVPAPPPPPPPPPGLPFMQNMNNENWRLAKKPASIASKVERDKKAKDNSASRKSDEFNSELKQRLSRINVSDSNGQNGGGRRLSSSITAQVFIDQHSTAEEVTDWLKRKGFHENTQRVLAGYAGSEIFQLSSEAFTGEFGQQEGSRLVSQLKLMKTTAGYTQSGSSQLLKILERRKQRADNERISQGSDAISDESDDFQSASMVRGSNGSEATRKY